MKVQVDGETVLELSELQKQVIKHEISDDIFVSDMKRRVAWILTHKYDEVHKSLRNEWESKLAANGVKSLPIDREEFAQLVFSQTNYKNRKQRDADENAERTRMQQSSQPTQSDISSS
jgi:hypothetical protein